MDESVFSGADKPRIINREEAAGDFGYVDVLAAHDGPVVLPEPPSQGVVERLTRVDQLPLVIERVDTPCAGRYIWRQWMLGARLELLNELMIERLVEFEYKVVLVAHCTRYLLVDDRLSSVASYRTLPAMFNMDRRPRLSCQVGEGRC